MQDEQIEELGKRLHQLAEAFQAACMGGDGIEAAMIVGRIRQTVPELKALARAVHGSRQPLVIREPESMQTRVGPSEIDA